MPTGKIRWPTIRLQTLSFKIVPFATYCHISVANGHCLSSTWCTRMTAFASMLSTEPFPTFRKRYWPPPSAHWRRMVLSPDKSMPKFHREWNIRLQIVHAHSFLWWKTWLYGHRIIWQVSWKTGISNGKIYYVTNFAKGYIIIHGNHIYH